MQTAVQKIIVIYYVLLRVGNASCNENCGDATDVNFILLHKLLYPHAEIFEKALKNQMLFTAKLRVLPKWMTILYFRTLC